jgi:hypothetical protein
MRHDYRYIHFPQCNKPHKYGHCVLSIDHYIREFIESNNEISKKMKCITGYSFCSPNDIYNKKIGKAKADMMKGGIRRRPLLFLFTDRDNDVINQNDVFLIVDHIVKCGFAPSWAVKSFSNNNVIYGSLNTRVSKV